MVESRINMSKIENYKWTSLLDLTGKGLSQFNAVGEKMNCSQIMRNAGLDWQVQMTAAQSTNGGKTITSDKFFNLVKDNKEILVGGLTNQYHPMQNEKLAELGDYFAKKVNINFEHCFSYDNDKAITFLANTNGSFNIGDDVVKNFLMFNNFHTGRDKIKINSTDISTWCSNTYMKALSDNEQFMLAITHRIEFNSSLENLVKHKIDLALKSNQEYKEQALTLNDVNLKEQDLLKYFILVYGDKELFSEFDKHGKKDYSFFNGLSGHQQVKRCYGIWHDTIESNGKTFKLQNTGNAVRKDTLWKAFNCVTYNEDHLRGGIDNQSSRLKNTFTSNGLGNVKTKAMTTALELAKAA
jgi:hypothetical protein